MTNNEIKILQIAEEILCKDVSIEQGDYDFFETNSAAVREALEAAFQAGREAAENGE